LVVPWISRESERKERNLKAYPRCWICDVLAVVRLAGVLEETHDRTAKDGRIFTPRHLVYTFTFQGEGQKGGFNHQAHHPPPLDLD
jgi:hypothetical protein